MSNAYPLHRCITHWELKPTHLSRFSHFTVAAWEDAHVAGSFIKYNRKNINKYKK